MEFTTRFEERYEQYKTNRNDALNRCFRRLAIWAVLLIPAIALGVWIYEDWVSWSFSESLEFIGSMLIMVITVVMALWPLTVVQTYKATVARLNREMSLGLMEASLKETFGDYVQGEVTYPILQSHCYSDAKVELNHRLAWLRTEDPLLIHRARITNGGTGEDEAIYFNGWAVSVPAGDRWKDMDRNKAEKMLRKAWKDTFAYKIAENPRFSLDEIDGRLWLTVGFHGLKLGEKDVSTGDLSAWFQESRENVRLFERAVALARTITPESCSKK